MLLTPLNCVKCGRQYSETGYWRDEVLCPACSINERRLEDEKKEDLRRKAAEIQEKYGLDFSKYPEDLDAGVREMLNPRNAGRKARKFQAEYCELLVEMAGEGKQEVEFAARIKVSQSLLTEWTERHPRFKIAREVANEVRAAWLHKYYRLGMLGKIDVNASMMIRMAAHLLGMGDKSESAVKVSGGEIPVVKIVERDAGFPAETLEPSAGQAAEAGQGNETV
jgi:DNA-directed RNA polymerase subunit RPC12/RpoP